MTNAVNIDKMREQIVQRYRALPELRQRIVQLLSVIYSPISRVTFLECLNQANIRNADRKAFITATLRPHLDALIEVGVVIQEKNQGPQCHPLLCEIATRDAIASKTFEAIVKAIETCLPIRQRWDKGPRIFTDETQFVREVRIGLYRKNLKWVEQLAEDYQRYSFAFHKIGLDQILVLIGGNPFDADWLLSMPPQVYATTLVSMLENGLMNLLPVEPALNCLQTLCNVPADDLDSPMFPLLLTEQLLYRGRLEDAQQSLTKVPTGYRDQAHLFEGQLALLQGNHDEAIAHYTHALKSFRKASGKRKAYFDTFSGVLLVLALIKNGSAARLQEAEEYTTLISKQPNHWLGSVHRMLGNVIKVQQGHLAAKKIITNTSIAPYQGGSSITTLLSAMCLYWVDLDLARKHLPALIEPLYEKAEASGYRWLAMEAAELLSRLRPRGPHRAQAAAFRQVNGNLETLVDIIQPRESWEISLNALANLGGSSSALGGSSKPETPQRLIWLVTFASNYCGIQPREQKITAKGAWTKGRPVSLKRLHDELSNFDYLTPHDLKVCQQIESDYTSHRYYGTTEYDFTEKAIAALIGHPLVFWEDSPTTRVDIVKGEPELLVKKSKKDWLTLEFLPAITGDLSVLVIKETPTRLKVIEVSAEHRRIAEILGAKNRLEVPESAKDRVLAAINGVSGVVTVHSDIGGGVENAKEVPAEATPHVHLLPAGGGLKVAVMARPFSQGGPYFRPGIGGETVIAEIEGERLQTNRNLKEEKKLAKNVVESCPVLSQYDTEDGEWLIEDPEDCLELLLDLQTLGEAAIIEWPEGEKMRIAHQAGSSSFFVNINRQKDWFEATGELKLDDNLVLDMQQLLQLLDKSPSRFLQLGDGQFLALTQEFRKRLDEFRSFSESQGKGARFHPLAAIALEDFMDEVGDLKADKHWKAHIKRMKEMQTLQPELPSTLQADLRDYQLDGFKWLARLAHWGVGACLADDMGLGKTLQALAVILTRAPQGPTLIVAPTSVGMNWMAEAEKFAPTLNPIQFGAGDRQQLLDNLQPLDMLVCTYGLLQQEDVADMLAKVQWQTIVLDEAQAIKNFATKRSKAAMNLQGEFKILTTGTPIENHLGELWNLFRFINPGLLGSLDNFNLHFANPIERQQDKQARSKLKKLIQPFLLRRTKNQVLQELPERTEITLHVELSKEEMAFYEALRRSAIAKLADSNAEAGTKHLQVLAEIMKLRRSCCNARLVTPDAQIGSAKLQLFGEVLGELIENRHKALVFSQFVDHLHIIRDYLDAQKISYQYLDGSTPAKDRKKRVDAFQAGQGDVFLISLKAGGTGLNLTAADYVIHMDPWWNPAVEDQASDRAHRIGQKRPVTIYRLVAKDTIEEKIVELHQHKRDLADSLLEGADMSGKTSTDDLLRLIQSL
jgi:superfamily II DNA or RNA helicase/tetratricopeptide (TPR) repeat protein